MHNFKKSQSYARHGLQKKSLTSEVRYERKKIWQHPKRNVLLDNIFVQSATPKIKWSWLALARQFVCLVLANIKCDVVYLMIDDTLTLRASKKAPVSQIHHQHGNKPNLASFVRGQCWVSLAMIARRTDKAPVALPVLSRLIPSAGNTGKLIATNNLIRSVYRLFQGAKVRVLVDIWYMRRCVSFHPYRATVFSP